MKHLVQEDAKLNAVDSQGRTPLIQAVLSAYRDPATNYQICIVLLQGGSDACKDGDDRVGRTSFRFLSLHLVINSVDAYKNNALHYAIESGNEALVNVFVSVPHCDVNFHNGEQMSPLHLAVRDNSMNTVALLLSDEHEKQANPNLQNRQGQTPLHLAASNGNQQIVQFLLQSNLDEPCDPTLIDSQRMTAYQLAKANAHDGCATLLQDYERTWTRLSPRGANSSTTDPRQHIPAPMNPADTFEEDPDYHSSRGSSRTSSESSGDSPGRVQTSTIQQSARTTGASSTAAKPETKTLADLIRSNPLTTEPPKAPTAKPASSTLTHLMGSIPLQPAGASSNTKPVPSKLDLYSTK